MASWRIEMTLIVLFGLVLLNQATAMSVRAERSHFQVQGIKKDCFASAP